jgi:hypothetical protein
MQQTGNRSMSVRPRVLLTAARGHVHVPQVIGTGVVRGLPHSLQ